MFYIFYLIVYLFNSILFIYLFLFILLYCLYYVYMKISDAKTSKSFWKFSFKLAFFLIFYQAPIKIILDIFENKAFNNWLITIWMWSECTEPKHRSPIKMPFKRKKIWSLQIFI